MKTLYLYAVHYEMCSIYNIYAICLCTYINYIYKQYICNMFYKKAIMLKYYFGIFFIIKLYFKYFFMYYRF